MSEGKGGSSKLDDEDDEEPVKPDDGTQDVLWEVGSLSDASDAEEKERRGVGGGKTSKGERRGLLVDEEEVEEGDRAGSSKREGEKEGDPFGDDQGFGEYEGVGQEDLPPETEDKK
jgi:hypothetical protein